MVLSLVQVVAGLLFLLISGDLLVRGSVALAKKLDIPALFIGLTIVAFGTSAPELVVGVQAALADPEVIGLAVGNVIGSNIANVLLGLGLPALFMPVLADQPMIRRNTFLMVFASFLLVYFAWDGGIDFTEGAILFGLIVLYLIYSAYRASTSKSSDFTAEEVEEVEQMEGLPASMPRMIFYIVLAIIGLPLGAHFTVQGGSALALAMDVPPSIIGLSVIALGTSLPEIATTLVAVFHRHSAVAIGNVIGSNLFNILAIMGVTAMVAVPANGEAIPIEPEFFIFDFWLFLGTALVVLPYTLAKGRIGRLSGVVFVVAYAAFIFALFNGHHVLPTAIVQ